MSAAILPAPPAADSLRRKRFTRAEVDRLLELGFFNGARFELIEGELIDKMGQNPPHAMAIQLLTAWLFRLLGPERVRVQLPIQLIGRDSDWSEPEPDIAVLITPSREYARRHPSADELLLIVEVSDSSFRQDAIVKRDLYARSSAPEYWILDIQGRRLIVYREPMQGEYKSATILNEGDAASFNGHSCPVRDLLP
ncbi:MAG TPA: Uma2 family endonuclease [Bryobacteraceae bacterium]|jgi:hypothetical protein|nr:Uma2 family endonuclease [Bryobacteraceae bacterium]